MRAGLAASAGAPSGAAEADVHHRTEPGRSPEGACAWGAPWRRGREGCKATLTEERMAHMQSVPCPLAVPVQGHHLVEVNVGTSVPRTWIKVCGTKKVVRCAARRGTLQRLRPAWVCPHLPRCPSLRSALGAAQPSLWLVCTLPMYQVSPAWRAGGRAGAGGGERALLGGVQRSMGHVPAGGRASDAHVGACRTSNRTCMCLRLRRRA